MSLIGLLDYFDRAKGREQYGALLDQYRVQGDPNQLPLGNTAAELDQSIQRQQGGFRGEGGLISGGPPQEFYMRAAALPGYQNLAQQAQVGQQALERQIQAQQWQENNLTAGQRAQIEVQKEQQQWERDRRTFEWNNPSAVQQANIDQGRAQLGISAGQLGVAQGNLALNQQQFAAQQAAAAAAKANPFFGLKPNEQIEFMDRVNTVDRAGAVAADLIDYYQRSGTGEVTLSPIDRNTLGVEWQGAMLPYLQQRFAAGAMQKGEQELFQELAGDPAKVFALKGKQLDLFKMWAADIDQTRNQLYGYAGVKPQPIQRGGSAFAKSRSAASAPKREDLIEWSP